MNRSLATAATTVVAALLGLAGCGHPPSGAPTSTTSSASPTTSESPSKLEVSNPKDLAAMASNACQLLTTEQLEQLGVAGTMEHSKSPWGEDSCMWGDVDGVSVSVSPSTQADYGLRSVLRSVGKEVPTKQINGYPMVVSQPLTYSCGIYVSTSSEDVFSLSAYVNDPKQNDPCALAMRAAAMVLSNLPPLKR